MPWLRPEPVLESTWWRREVDCYPVSESTAGDLHIQGGVVQSAERTGAEGQCSGTSLGERQSAIVLGQHDPGHRLACRTRIIAEQRELPALEKHIRRGGELRGIVDRVVQDQRARDGCRAAKGVAAVQSDIAVAVAGERGRTSRQVRAERTGLDGK